MAKKQKKEQARKQGQGKNGRVVTITSTSRTDWRKEIILKDK